MKKYSIWLEYRSKDGSSGTMESSATDSIEKALEYARFMRDTYKKRPSNDTAWAFVVYEVLGLNKKRVHTIFEGRGRISPAA